MNCQIFLEGKEKRGYRFPKISDNYNGIINSRAPQKLKITWESALNRKIAKFIIH